MKKILVYEIEVADEAQELQIIAELESVIGMKPTRTIPVEELNILEK